MFEAASKKRPKKYLDKLYFFEKLKTKNWPMKPSPPFKIPLFENCAYSLIVNK